MNLVTTGTLIPPWFVPNNPTCDDLATASVIWGMSIGLTTFGLIRAGRQTLAQWQRTHRITAYIVLVWLELVSSTIIGGLAWGYVRQNIRPSLWYFTGMIFLWIFQVHCILQIIITRIDLLELNKTIVFRLRRGVFATVLLINMSVACIWIPARLQRSQDYIHLNEIWDRIEKSIVALVDLGLNAYFIYLVRSSLVAYGLTKYARLYRFNLVMIFISMTMDVLIIVMMSLSNTFLYVCFHPLAYLVKLHIEISMSDLIAKIVKASVGRSCAWDMSSPYGTPELSGPYFGFQQQQHRNSCNSNSPISGRLCHMWSSCCFRRRKTLSIQAPHGPGDPIQRPTKLARMETYNPRKFSWVPTRGSSVSGTGDLEVGVPPDMTTPTNTSATVTTNSGSDPTYGRG